MSPHYYYLESLIKQQMPYPINLDYDYEDDGCI